MPVSAPGGSSAGEDGGFVGFAGNLYFNAFNPSTGDVLSKLAGSGGPVTPVSDGSGGLRHRHRAHRELHDHRRQPVFRSRGQRCRRRAGQAQRRRHVADLQLQRQQSKRRRREWRLRSLQQPYLFLGGYHNLNSAILDLIAFDPGTGNYTEISTRDPNQAQFGSSAGEDGGFVVFNNALYFNAYSDTLGGTLMRLAAG